MAARPCMTRRGSTMQATTTLDAVGDRRQSAPSGGGVVGAPVHGGAINEICRRVDEEGVTSRWCSECAGCATVFLFCC